MIPDILRGKICHSARTSGFLQENGVPPECIGSKCSDYYGCISSILTSYKKIEEFQETDIGRKIIAELEGRERP
jgi:hypothetical protein